MSKRRVVLRFEDNQGDRMDLLLVQKGSGFQVFARHVRRKLVNEGASSTHQNEKYAEEALNDLARQVRAKGWEPRLPKHKDEPSRMTIDKSTGERVFRTSSGEPIEDTSASNPPKVKMPDVPVRPKKETKPEAKLDELLKQ